MTSLEQLGAFVARHQPDERACLDARLHAADAIGAWIAACGIAEGRMLLAFRKDADGLAECIAVHVALARLSEIDDIHLASMTTPGSVIVPSVLTIAASLPDVTAADVAAAVVVGYEAMIRLGVAIDGPSVLYRGIWPTYFTAPFGVAAAAARLLKLDAGQTAHALSAALIMAAPGTGHHAAPTTVRWLAAGHAAARGWQAARAAGAGFTSDVKIADGEFLKNIFNVIPNAALLAGGLGGIAISQTSFKPWCAARQTMAATQALKEIVSEGIAPGAIARIGVAVPPPHLKMINHGVTAGDRFSHLTSIQYQMAVAAIEPERADQLTVETPPSAAIADLMSRIQVRAEEGLLTGGYPKSWPARVTVTADRRRERIVTDIPGDPARPYGEAELKDKFVRMTARLLDRQRAELAFAAALKAFETPVAAIHDIGTMAAS